MRKIEHRIIDNIEYKLCSHCKKWKPVNEFSKCSTTCDGFQQVCKECRKQNYIENKKQILEQQKQYYQFNREQKLEYQKKYREEHPEKHKQWLSDNEEHRMKYAKMYYASLRGYSVRLRGSNLKYDCKRGFFKKSDIPANYPTVEDYIRLIQQPDHYDGKYYPFNKMGVDRIDNDKPHTLDNIVPCSTKNNVRRQMIPYEEFKKLVQDNKTN